MEFKQSHCPYCGEGLSTVFEEERERLYCRVCDRIIWRNASPVSAVVVEKDEELLFVKRGIEPGKGEWSLPAGFLEYEEEPAEAAARELEEETGLEVDEEDLRLVDTLNIERFEGQRLLATVYKIRAEKASGNISPGSDAEEARYWCVERLREDESEVLRKHFLEVIGEFS